MELLSLRLVALSIAKPLFLYYKIIRTKPTKIAIEKTSQYQLVTTSKESTPFLICTLPVQSPGSLEETTLGPKAQQSDGEAVRETQDRAALGEAEVGISLSCLYLWNTHPLALVVFLCAGLLCYLTASLGSFQFSRQHQYRSYCT